jgi:hypothetical protein
VALELKQEDFDCGAGMLQSSAAQIRRSLVESGYSSTGPPLRKNAGSVCRTIVGVLNPPEGTSEDYRLAVALVAWIVLVDLTEHAADTFWRTSDERLARALLDQVEEQQQQAIRKRLEEFERSMGWTFDE